ncbi:MAG TPA: hypothetical protein VN255_10190, partial [Mycobacterium sp.]|nr:hypothetical protein [Mycobacterium sp.]
MVADPDKAENAGKKQSWFQTLPGFLTATAALLTAIGGIITLVVDYFSHPTGTTSQATATGPTPPAFMPTISLPGADWQGWL